MLWTAVPKAQALREYCILYHDATARIRGIAYRARAECSHGVEAQVAFQLKTAMYGNGCAAVLLCVERRHRSRYSSTRFIIRVSCVSYHHVIIPYPLLLVRALTSKY